MKNVSVKAHKELQANHEALLKNYETTKKLHESLGKLYDTRGDELRQEKDKHERLKNSFNKTLLDLRSHELAVFEGGRESRGLVLAMAALAENTVSVKKELLLEKFKRDPFKYKTLLNQSFDEDESVKPEDEVMSRSRLKREAIQRSEKWDPMGVDK